MRKGDKKMEKTFKERMYDREVRERWLQSLPDGIPCDHPGCLHHLSHPCEVCKRIAGVRSGENEKR